MNHLSFLILLFAVCAPLETLPGQPAAGSAMDPRLAIPATDEGLPGMGPIRRQDWFQRTWNKHRSAWAQRTAIDRHAVVFLGDSITEGWQNLSTTFPELKVANRGIGGDTSRGVLIRLHADVLALQPRAIVLLIGTNDIEEQAGPETIAGNVKLILGAINAHDPELPVVLCEVFPSSPIKKRPPEKIRRLNELYRGLADGHPQVTFVETWRVFANEEGNAKPEEFPDLLHPNDAGYARWAVALRPVLAQLGLARAGATAGAP